MKLSRTGDSAFTLTVAPAELSALIAALRLAAEILQQDEQTPAGAIEQLRGLLSDYERAIARLDEHNRTGAVGARPESR